MTRLTTKSPGSEGETKTMTLREALGKALEQNPDVLLARLDDADHALEVLAKLRGRHAYLRREPLERQIAVHPVGHAGKQWRRQRGI